MVIPHHPAGLSHQPQHSSHACYGDSQPGLLQSKEESSVALSDIAWFRAEHAFSGIGSLLMRVAFGETPRWKDQEGHLGCFH